MRFRFYLFVMKGNLEILTNYLEIRKIDVILKFRRGQVYFQ